MEFRYTLKNSLLKFINFQVGRFLFVGGLGFFVDYGVFLFLLGFLGPYISRILSIFTAMVFTWFLNRKITFKFKETVLLKEFWKYILASKFSMLLNYFVFFIFIYVFNVNYIVGVLFSSGVAAVSNFFLYKKI